MESFIERRNRRMVKYKLIDIQWHIGHAYEMLKFPFVDWFWLYQYKRPPYSNNIRGDLGRWFTYKHFYEPEMYDAAILHLDQECLEPRSWSREKGLLYSSMNEIIRDIPKIVIMHGSPHYPEAPHPYSDQDWMISRLKEVVGSNYLVVNSYQAATQWGWGHPIIHGMEEREWFCLPKRPRVVTTLSAAGMDSYYDRSFLTAVREKLQKIDIPYCHLGVDYLPASWHDYRTFLGESLIYFNPTRESPMPRARTEAMFSGCCVVTTPFHDADDFIETGRNGFLVSRDVDVVSALIADLIEDPAKTTQIGLNGRQTALLQFDWNRFSAQWNSLLKTIVGTPRELR
jgi:glycosyltransferase involved in cell wall biosynthesis